MKKLNQLLLLITAICSLNALAQMPTTGLAAYYPFTGNANDQSGNANHGIVSGAILTTDRFGNNNSAYEFNGTSSYITVADNINNDLDSLYTISAWYMPYAGYGSGSAPAWTGNMIINKWGVGGINNAQFMFGVNTAGTFVASNFTHTVVTNPPLLSTNTISINTWHHLLVTFKNNKLRFYKNGVLTDSLANVCNPQPSNYPLVIGREEYGNYGYQKGKIDDIRIYKRALSTAEIQLLFNESVGVSGINTITNNNSIKIYPNPAKTELNINTDINYSSLVIVNSLGQVLLKKEKMDALSIESLSNGVYFIQLLNKENKVIAIKKFIKE
jgi:hypothetical protein